MTGTNSLMYSTNFEIEMKTFIKKKTLHIIKRDPKKNKQHFKNCLSSGSSKHDISFAKKSSTIKPVCVIFLKLTFSFYFSKRS